MSLNTQAEAPRQRFAASTSDSTLERMGFGE